MADPDGHIVAKSGPFMNGGSSAPVLQPRDDSAPRARCRCSQRERFVRCRHRCPVHRPPPDERSFVPDLHFVEISKDRRVYIGERGQNRIQVFTTDGRWLQDIMVSPNSPAQRGECGGLNKTPLAAPGPSLFNRSICGTTCKMVISKDPQQKYARQVYVERYPEMGARQQISIDSGTVPAWSANGRELYFMDSYARQVLAVTTDSGPTLAVGQPKVVLEGEFLPAQTGWRPLEFRR